MFVLWAFTILRQIKLPPYFDLILHNKDCHVLFTPIHGGSFLKATGLVSSVLRREVMLLAVWLEGALDARDTRRTLCVVRGETTATPRCGLGWGCRWSPLAVSVKHKTCCHWTRLSIKARVSSDVFPQGFLRLRAHSEHPTFMSEQLDLWCQPKQWEQNRLKLVTNLVQVLWVFV